GQASLMSSANHDFPSQMAAICGAILRLAEDMRLSRRPPSPGLFAPLQHGIEQLVEGLALHAGADVMARAQRLHAMLSRSIAILELEGIRSFFGAHNAADVVRIILGDGAPNLGSAQRRGLAGQQIIVACGRAALGGAGRVAIPTGPSDPIVAVA